MGEEHRIQIETLKTMQNEKKKEAEIECDNVTSLKSNNAKHVDIENMNGVILENAEKITKKKKKKRRNSKVALLANSFSEQNVENGKKMNKIKKKRKKRNKAKKATPTMMLEEELLSQICDNKENEEDMEQDVMPLDEGKDVLNNLSNTLMKEGAEGMNIEIESDTDMKETGHRHVRSRNSMSLDNIKNGIDFEELNAIQNNEHNLSDSGTPNEIVQDID